MSYDLTALAQRARAAERMLALAGSTQKNQALLSAADALEGAADDILTSPLQTLQLQTRETGWL